MDTQPTVYIVDDSPEMLRTITGFLRTAGLNVEAYSSAEEFLAAWHPESEGCLILDIQMPGMTGIELQELLQNREISLPVIIVTGCAVVKDAVRSMKLGSFDFIEKPYEPLLLLRRIQDALKCDQERRARSTERKLCRERFAKLTNRERQVLSYVISGKPSKTIASTMNLSVSTVDNHRANILKKLNASTSADLARIALMVDPDLAFSGSD